MPSITSGALRSAHRTLCASRSIAVQDFLAPAILHKTGRSRRALLSTAMRAGQVPDSKTQQAIGPDKTGMVSARRGQRKSLSAEQVAYLSAALRVNQAGELAATRIYAAQTRPLVARHPHLRPLLRHMYDQEAGHLRTFNRLLVLHRVRPTAMYPAWAAMSSGLGWATALMGREAAMACTEAVETEIGEHYNTQIRSLLEIVRGWEEDGCEVGEEFRELLATLRRIRDEELEHLDHAVEHDAKKAEPHWFLTGVIRMGCRGAIWLSERV